MPEFSEIEQFEDSTCGQIAYEAYCEHTGWKSLISGDRLPQWKDVDPRIKEAWEAAGEAVYDFALG